MKRYINLTLLIFVCLLCACGGGNNSQANSSMSPTDESSGVDQPNVDEQPSDDDSGSNAEHDETAGSNSDQNDDNSDSGSANDDESESEPVPEKVLPGNYAGVTGCTPFKGSEFAALKIFFINLNEVSYFQALVDDAVEKQFKTIEPFNEFYSNIAFYSLSVGGLDALNCEGTNESLSSSGFQCDAEKVHQFITSKCAVDDIYGVIKVVIAESRYASSASEIIHVGTLATESDEQSVLSARNIIIHEVAHNLGLADLYGGGFSTSGLAEGGWPKGISREWLNLDGPGCPKWCGSFKPASEYTQSSNAVCQTFTTREECFAFNRDEEGFCDSNSDSQTSCCGWVHEKDDYFDSYCVPAWGYEDIGLNCVDGAGCFYGGAYGINSWRPVNIWTESIMHSALAPFFDSVSEESIRQVLRCCASPEDVGTSCMEFREKFADFLGGAMLFKQRIGSCGFKFASSIENIMED